MKILGASHDVQSRQHCGLVNYRKYFLLYEIQLLCSPNLLLSASEFQLLISSSKRQNVGLLIFDPSFPWLGKIPWRRKWQPTPVFLPGESHGWRTLVGYSPQGHKESDMTERLHFHFSFHDCVSFHGERQCVCSYLY